MMTKNKDTNRKKWMYLVAAPMIIAAFIYVSCESSSDEPMTVDVMQSSSLPDKPTPPSIPNEPEEEVFIIVEEMPLFKGNEVSSFKNHIIENLKYPTGIQKDELQGEIVVQFIINKAGEVENANIVKSMHPLLDAEVLRIVKESPTWQPGKQRGTKVNVAINLPIKFE